jgi:ankyrin repeat protein
MLNDLLPKINNVNVLQDTLLVLAKYGKTEALIQILPRVGYPVWLEQPIYQAVKFNQPKALNILLDREKDVSSSSVHEEVISDALKEAVIHNQIGIFNQLLPKVNNPSGALEMAVEYNRIEMFNQLLPKTNDHNTALILAVTLNQIEMFKQLLPKANNHNLALELAVKFNQVEMFEELLPIVGYNENVLKEIIKRNQIQMFNQLLPKINDPDFAIWKAVEYNRIEMFNQLLPHVNDPSLALLTSVMSNSTEMFNQLLPRVSDPWRGLEIAIEYDRPEMFNQLLPYVKYTPRNVLYTAMTYDRVDMATQLFEQAKKSNTLTDEIKEQYEQFIKSIPKKDIAQDKGIFEQISDTLAYVDKGILQLPGADAASVQYINNMEAINADLAFMREAQGLNFTQPRIGASKQASIEEENLLKYGALIAVSGYALYKAGQAINNWMEQTPSAAKEGISKEELQRKSAKLLKHLQELKKELDKVSKNSKNDMFKIIKEQIDNYTEDLTKVKTKAELKELKEDIRHTHNQLAHITLKNAVERSKDKESKNVGTSLIRLNKLERTIAKLLESHELPSSIEKELKEERKEIKRIITESSNKQTTINEISKEAAQVFKKLGDTSTKINNSKDLSRGSKILLEEIKSVKDEVKKITKTAKDVLHPMREEKLKKRSDPNKGNSRG